MLCGRIDALFAVRVDSFLRVLHVIPRSYVWSEVNTVTLPQAHVSQYRTGRLEFPDHVSGKIAQALGVPPGYVIAEINVHRAKRTDEKKIWKQISATFKKAAAMSAVGRFLPVTILALGSIE